MADVSIVGIAMIRHNDEWEMLFEKQKLENASLREENEELKIKNQQYLEKMDKFPLSEKQELELQILELETEITSLRRSLKFAVEALEKVDFNHEISSYLLIRQALATIKAKGEL